VFTTTKSTGNIACVPSSDGNSPSSSVLRAAAHEGDPDQDDPRQADTASPDTDQADPLLTGRRDVERVTASRSTSAPIRRVIVRHG